MAYNLVQTFFMSSAAVGGAGQILLSSISVYFKNKPSRSGNRSGLVNPTVSMQICEATRNGPSVTGMANSQRAILDWDSITKSSNGNTPTTFTFDPPIKVLTDRYYGAFIQLSDTDYTLWDAKAGDRRAGTNSPFSGANFDGSLYEGTSDTNFRALSGKDLKISISAKRFVGDEAVTSNFVPEAYEFIKTDSQRGVYLNAERVFQDVSNKTLAVPVYMDMPGSLQINALSTRIVGTGTNFTNLVSGGFVVLSTTANNDLYAIQQIANVQNSTVLTLKDYPPFSSVDGNGRYTLSPVADVYESRPYHQTSGDIVLFKSTANATHKFVTGGLRGVTVSNTGAGYSNTNIVRVPAPVGGTDAVFSITTNAGGSITSLGVINSGRGFTAPVAPRIEVSVSDPTVKSGNPGANAVITVAANQIGTILRGHKSGASANISLVENKILSEIWPVFQELVPASGTIKAKHTFSDGSPLAVGEYPYQDTKLGVLNSLNDHQSVLSSKSNEVVANSAPSSKFSLDMSVKRPTSFLFETPYIESARATVVTYENDINNDATNEHTNSGNALSKYISKRISFDSDVSSEDLIVFVRGQRPVGTDIKVYGKFHSSTDDEAFDDKAWTELERTSANQYTDPKNPSQQVQMEYTIPQFPEVAALLPGVVTTSNGSSNVVGIGTSWSNTLVGSTVRIYNPLTPQQHQVGYVVSVANTTQLTLGSPVVNNSIQSSVVGPGMRMESLKYKGTVFNNIQNDNVSRYFTMSTGAEIDGFDTFAIKIVLLSENKYIVPSVNDIRMVGVSA